MCLLACAVCVLYLLVKVWSPSPSLKTFVSAPSTHAQSSEHARRLTRTGQEPGWFPCSTAGAPFSHCWCPSSSNQCHHEHRRMALLQSTHQNVYSAGGEHVPRGGWCPRPQGLPPTQGERPYSTEVPELPLWPRPGHAGTNQSPLTRYFIRNPF